MVESNVSRSKIPTNSQYPINLNNRTISSTDIITYGNRNDEGKPSLSIFHHNIHGLKGKID